MSSDKLDIKEIKKTIEVILFMSSRPVNKNTIQKILSINGKSDILDQALVELISDYKHSEKGIFIREVAGGFQIATKEEYAEIIRKLLLENKKRSLSHQALETLAIIAYKQPITSAEISEVRGKNSVFAIKTLLEKKLIRISGRKNAIGKPFLYATTSEFLLKFGLNNLSELPKLVEFSDYAESNEHENKESSPSESTC